MSFLYGHGCASMAPKKNPCLSPHLFLLFLLLFFLNTNSFAANYISANQSLSGSQILTSEGGNFVLGFFQPGNSSHNYYIGIWYKKLSKITPVWEANRETPINDPTSSVLRISGDGNLVLLNQARNQIWSTNVTSITSNSTVAVILDSGNLVLRDGSNSSKVLWQSFDHPTNTLLPGAKLGLNKVTGKYHKLTSWKNSDDPAPGFFSLEIDPNGTNQYLLHLNNSKMYWSSGTWNGQIFASLPELTAYFAIDNTSGSEFYTFEYVSNDRENYFIYSVMQDTVIIRFIMDISGQIQKLTWQKYAQEWILAWAGPKDHCDVFALCGPFGSCNERSVPFCNCVEGFSEASSRDWDLGDHSEGCVRNTRLLCGRNRSVSGELDRFFPMPNMRLPENPQSLVVGSVHECESACLNNCSCTAYSYISGCSIWYENLLNLKQLYDGSNGETLYLRLAPSELQSSKSSKGLVIRVVAATVASFGVFLAIVWLLIWRHRRGTMMRTSKALEGTLVLYKYSYLQSVTKNFSEKLGGGGFGSVYKGILHDSTAIAVKKLEGLNQGEKQFRAEVSTMGTIQHVNLVRLRGFCSEGTKRLLVYDYMPNGSLATQLFRSSSMVLDWETRFQVALGTARGLAYLHEKCRDCIIHCDIKPENILLDASFDPKVADFGLAKIVGRDFSRVLTTMRGTIGYLAPEWISGVAITTKADVYSYGMMLFEIVSGRRNAEQLREGGTAFFPLLVVEKLKGGDVLSLLDHRLEGDAKLEELNRACKVACWCIQDNENHRPSMGQVLQILEGVVEVGIPAIPRSLQNLADDPENFFHSKLVMHSTISASSQAKNILSCKDSKE